MLAVFLALIGLALSVSAQSQAYSLNDRQTRELLNRIARRSETFSLSLNAAHDRGRFDGTRRENEINRFVLDLTQATNRLTDASGGKGAAIGAAVGAGAGSVFIQGRDDLELPIGAEIAIRASAPR
jgi:hypothetical protein